MQISFCTHTHTHCGEIDSWNIGERERERWPMCICVWPRQEIGGKCSFKNLKLEKFSFSWMLTSRGIRQKWCLAQSLSIDKWSGFLLFKWPYSWEICMKLTLRHGHEKVKYGNWETRITAMFNMWYENGCLLYNLSIMYIVYIIMYASHCVIIVTYW